MQKKKMIIFASASCAVLALSVIAVTHSYVSNRAFADYEDRNPYTRSLTIDASYFQNGSGTLTVEGNQFAYSGVTIEGNNISFAQDGYFRSVVDSGASSGSDLSGAGFTSLNARMSAAFNGNVTLNGQSQALNLSSNAVHSFAVNKNNINLVFNASGFKVSEFVVSYKCLANDINIDGAANETIWSSEVMSNPLLVKLNDSYKTEVYCHKNESGIYVYAEQHVAVVKNAGDGWWQKDNLEFHIDSGTAYRNYGITTTKQYFVSMNGGTTFDQFAHTGPVLNPSTNLYDINYEAFVSWTTLGLLYEDLQIVIVGSNYNGDAFTWNRSDVGYHSERSHNLEIMTKDGFKPWSLDYLASGTELISTPISQGADEGWNYRTGQARVSTSSSFLLRIKSHAENASTHLNDLGAGFVGEFVSSNGWGEGGCSFRKDWNGWGGFAPNTEANPNKFDIDNISTAAWGEGASVAFQEASNAMDFEVIYCFRGTTIDVLAKGVSTYTGHVGQTYYMTMRFKDVSSLANIDIGVGYNLGSCTISSYQAIVGSATLL